MSEISQMVKRWRQEADDVEGVNLVAADMLRSCADQLASVALGRYDACPDCQHTFDGDCILSITP